AEGADVIEEAKPAKAKREELTTGEKKTLEEATVAPVDEADETEAAPAVQKASDDESEDDEAPAAPQVYSEDQLREKISKLPILFGQKDKSVATDADLAAMQAAIEEGEKYKYPGLDLLEEPEANFNEKLEETVKEQAAALIQALQQFKIDGQVDSIE